MMVDKDSYALEYQQREYAFCSLQCRQRFESNPHLYVGRPGHPAPAQHGHEILKKRKLKLSEPLSDQHCDLIKLELNNMMGIRAVDFESDCLFISYDLMQVTVKQIEMAIENTGNKLRSDMGTRLRQAFVHYMEETELDNLEEPGHGHRH